MSCRKYNRPSRPLTVENLEGRRPFAADLQHGVLTVSGTPQNDAIEISSSKGTLTVTVNNAAKSFGLSKVTSIEVHAGEGNDSVRLSNSIRLPSQIFGDDGNDILHGGGGRDEIHGGDGRDVISGGDGVDRLFGDLGNDKLDGNSGADHLFGGGGRDQLKGGVTIVPIGFLLPAGFDDDVLDGGDGDDTLEGGSGNDTLTGDNGDDTLSGGEGEDNLSGGDGDDTLDGGDGSDQISGGAGTDHIVQDESDDVHDN